MPDSPGLKEQGGELFRVLVEQLPDHVPEKFGSSEPLRGLFTPNRIDSILPVWKEKGDLFVRRSRPFLDLHVHCWPQSPDPKHSSVLLEFESQCRAHTDQLREFLFKASELLRADYAMAHLLTECEFNEALEIIRQCPTIWPQESGENAVKRLNNLAAREGSPYVLSLMATSGINTVTLREVLAESVLAECVRTPVC